jgi:mRNA capping enzyme, beta chain
MDVEQRVERDLENPILTEYLAKLMPEKIDGEMEMEVRFGRIVDKITGKRLALQTAHYCIIEKSDSLRFEAKMQCSDFKKAEKCMREGGVAERRAKTVDSVIKGVRETRFLGEEGRDPVYVEKKKLWYLDIYCPQNRYDVRLSFSRERRLDKSVSGQFQGKCPLFSRRKDRTTYAVGNVSVEFTVVREEGGERQLGDREEVQYELEIEADSEKYERASVIRKIGNFMGLFEEKLRER